MAKAVRWTHADERGKKKYKSIQALAEALKISYPTARKYVEKGYKSDDDLIHTRRIPSTLSDRDAFWERVREFNLESKRRRREARKEGKE